MTDVSVWSRSSSSKKKSNVDQYCLSSRLSSANIDHAFIKSTMEKKKYKKRSRNDVLVQKTFPESAPSGIILSSLMENNSSKIREANFSQERIFESNAS